MSQTVFDENDFVKRVPKKILERTKENMEVYNMDLTVLSPIRCKTLLDGGRRRTKNLYGVFKRTVPAGQVRQ